LRRHEPRESTPFLTAGLEARPEAIANGTERPFSVTKDFFNGCVRGAVVSKNGIDVAHDLCVPDADPLRLTGNPVKAPYRWHSPFTARRGKGFEIALRNRVHAAGL
jgi:hypothetical protein